MLHVIGIGSPFGDDRIGLLLIEELRRTGILQPYLGSEIELHQLDRPGANLLAELEGMGRVVIIDAVMTGGAVGQLHCWSDPSMIEQGSLSSSSHGFGVAQTLALGRALGSLPRHLKLLGVEIAPPEIGTELSLQLRQQLSVLAGRAADEIVACLPPLGWAR